MGNRIISKELIELGDRIRNRREEIHMTQETLAEKAKISPNTVSRIESGQVAMSIRTFRKLMEALGVDANKLLGNKTLDSMETETLRQTFNRVRELRQRDRDIVARAMKALVDELEKNT